MTSPAELPAKRSRSLTTFYVVLGITVALGLFAAWFWKTWSVQCDVLPSMELGTVKDGQFHAAQDLADGQLWCVLMRIKKEGRAAPPTCIPVTVEALDQSGGKCLTSPSGCAPTVVNVTLARAPDWDSSSSYAYVSPEGTPIMPWAGAIPLSPGEVNIYIYIPTYGTVAIQPAAPYGDSARGIDIRLVKKPSSH